MLLPWVGRDGSSRRIFARFIGCFHETDTPPEQPSEEGKSPKTSERDPNSVATNYSDDRYFLTVIGAENWVFSHIILSVPPPAGFFSMDIVNWSTGLSSVSFSKSTRATSRSSS